MTKVYGYCIEIENGSDDYYTDRGYIFADNHLSATNKLLNEYKSEDEGIYHFEIFDFTPNENDVHSVYSLLCESCGNKVKLANELRGWSLI